MVQGMAKSNPDHDGIDVSHWNVITDWDAIPDYDLWCMKATEGKGFRSPVFNERWPKIRELQVKCRGAYHWIRSDSSMKDQVANLKRAIDDHGGLQVGEFVMLDWETTPGIANVTVAMVEEWLDLAEKEWPGRIIVYCSDWVPGFKTWRKNNPDYPLWYANYRLERDDRGGEAESDQWGADVWQWTSSALVPGYKAGIDMNDVLEWDTLFSISGYADDKGESPDVPTAPPAPPPAFNPPHSWGLFPLDPNKPKLHEVPPRNKQSKEHVRYLQAVLKFYCGQHKMSVDGWFGPQTKLAVTQFQKYLGLTVDGWVGPQTWGMIDFIVSAHIK